MGVIGGISPQATMDFEARVHHASQRLIPQRWNGGYPPMVVWYSRTPPIRLGADDLPVMPLALDPGLVEAAAWLGRASDFLVITCNTAHIGLQALAKAAACPILSMIDVTLAEIERRGWKRVGVLGFHGASPLYLDPLRQRGIHCETIGPGLQEPLDAGIRAVAEGRDGAAETGHALAAVAALRAAAVDGAVLGCTEIPLLLGKDGEAADLLSPAALLADAAVRFAIGEPASGTRTS